MMFYPTDPLASEASPNRSPASQPPVDDAAASVDAVALLDAAFDALIALDSDCRVTALNESARSLFAELNAPDIQIGQRLAGVPEAALLEAAIEDALANREESYEDQVTLGGHMYRVRINVTQGSTRDQAIIHLALQDVTQLVRLNRARRDMVSNISHELRTPISNIRLTIESLFREAEKPKRKPSREALKAISRETDQLLHLVEELHDLSMIETGQAIMRLTEYSLHQLVDEVMARMQDQSEGKQLRLVNDVPVDVQVLCDADQMRRVVVNLVHNAVKWSPYKGKIVVRAVSDGEEVTVTIKDDGPGVP
ncbi:MAG: hypothetical protein H7175_14010, partial [Burkholderiales bacterium]|nr:hypothetical protein [Anaerolineae bacterium]